MGQQQLLLVILVTIIVGIATVVAINTFSSAADSANLDAVRQDIGNIAGAAQGYYMKPKMLAGGGRTFDGANFATIPFNGTITTDKNVAYNENGTYKIMPYDTTLTVKADPASGENYEEGTSGSADNTISATISRNHLVITSQ